MKVNYKRTVEKQYEERHEAWLKARQEKLDVMTEEEREEYLADEKKEVQEVLSLLGFVNSHLSDTPYSNL